MCSDTHYNPLNTDGFEFVEYTAADEKGINDLANLFTSLGFAEVAKHRSKRVWLFKQGDINFIINAEPARFTLLTDMVMTRFMRSTFDFTQAGRKKCVSVMQVFKLLIILLTMLNEATWLSGQTFMSA